jgi:hypothetical protein
MEIESEGFRQWFLDFVHRTVGAFCHHPRGHRVNTITALSTLYTAHRSFAFKGAYSKAQFKYCGWVGLSCFVLSYMARCSCISAALVLNLFFEGQMDKWYKTQF